MRAIGEFYETEKSRDRLVSWVSGEVSKMDVFEGPDFPSRLFGVGGNFLRFRGVDVPISALKFV